MCQTTEAVDHEHGDTLQALRDRCAHLENMLDFLQNLCDRRAVTIAKLESDLDAIGAGGVGQLLPRNHSEQDLNMVQQPAQVTHTDYQITELAHRTCWRYRHSSDPRHSHTYTFNRVTLLDFVRQLREGGLA